MSSSDDATVETICWSVFSPVCSAIPRRIVRRRRPVGPPTPTRSATVGFFGHAPQGHAVPEAAGDTRIRRRLRAGGAAPFPRADRHPARGDNFRCRLESAAVADVNPSAPRPQSCRRLQLDLAPSRSVERDGAEVALVRARVEDLGDLLDREPELVVGGEVVRAQADAGVGAEVAENRPRLELGVDGRELRTRSTTVPPRRSGSRALVTSKPAASARSMRSCVCRRSSRGFGRPRSPPRGRTRPSPHSGRRRSACPSGTAPRLSRTPSPPRTRTGARAPASR